MTLLRSKIIFHNKKQSPSFLATGKKHSEAVDYEMFIVQPDDMVDVNMKLF